MTRALEERGGALVLGSPPKPAAFPLLAETPAFLSAAARIVSLAIAGHHVGHARAFAFRHGLDDFEHVLCGAAVPGLPNEVLLGRGEANPL